MNMKQATPYAVYKGEALILTTVAVYDCEMELTTHVLSEAGSPAMTWPEVMKEIAGYEEYHSIAVFNPANMTVRDISDDCAEEYICTEAESGDDWEPSEEIFRAYFHENGRDAIAPDASQHGTLCRTIQGAVA